MRSADKTLRMCRGIQKSQKKHIRKKLSKKRQLVSFKYKQAISNRDGNKCLLCGDINHLVMHHILPVSKYPILIDDIRNLATLCKHCHLYEAHDGHFSRLNNEVKLKLFCIVTNFNPN